MCEGYEEIVIVLGPLVQLHYRTGDGVTSLFRNVHRPVYQTNDVKTYKYL